MSHTLNWLLSLIAGLLILLALGLHMSYVTVSYLLVIALTLYHGFFGLHTMLTEYWSGPRAARIIAGGCIISGGGLLALAIATALID